jgi:hypothetical protein
MTKNHRQRNDMCTALKHDLANRKTEKDGVVETAVTKWLIILYKTRTDINRE